MCRVGQNLGKKVGELPTMQQSTAHGAAVQGSGAHAPAHAGTPAAIAARPKVIAARRKTLKTLGGSLLRVIPELSQPDLRRYSAPTIEVTAAAGATSGIGRAQSSPNPACSSSSIPPPLGPIVEGNPVQPGEHHVGNEHFAHQSPPPQGSLCTRAATLVIRWWMCNQLPIRIIDLILGWSLLDSTACASSCAW